MSQSHLDQIREMLGTQFSRYKGGAELAAQQMASDEEVIAVVPGIIGKTSVVAFATDKQVVVAGKVMFLRELHQFPYGRINSLDLGGVGLGWVGFQDLHINAGGGGISVRVLDPKEAENFVNVVNGQLASLSHPQSRAETSADAAAALERLAQLHQKGAISDEEFAAKKAELLDRI